MILFNYLTDIVEQSSFYKMCDYELTKKLPKATKDQIASVPLYRQTIWTAQYDYIVDIMGTTDRKDEEFVRIKEKYLDASKVVLKSVENKDLFIFESEEFSDNLKIELFRIMTELFTGYGSKSRRMKFSTFQKKYKAYCNMVKSDNTFKAYALKIVHYYKMALSEGVERYMVQTGGSRLVLNMMPFSVPSALRYKESIKDTATVKKLAINALCFLMLLPLIDVDNGILYGDQVKVRHSFFLDIFKIMNDKDLTMQETTQKIYEYFLPNEEIILDRFDEWEKIESSGVTLSGDSRKSIMKDICTITIDAFISNYLIYTHYLLEPSTLVKHSYNEFLFTDEATVSDDINYTASPDVEQFFKEALTKVYRTAYDFAIKCGYKYAGIPISTYIVGLSNAENDSTASDEEIDNPDSPEYFYNSDFCNSLTDYLVKHARGSIEYDKNATSMESTINYIANADTDTEKRNYTVLDMLKSSDLTYSEDGQKITVNARDFFNQTCDPRYTNQSRYLKSGKECGTFKGRLCANEAIPGRKVSDIETKYLIKETQHMGNQKYYYLTSDETGFYLAIEDSSRRAFQYVDSYTMNFIDIEKLLKCGGLEYVSCLENVLLNNYLLVKYVYQKKFENEENIAKSNPTSYVFKEYVEPDFVDFMVDCANTVTTIRSAKRFDKNNSLLKENLNYLYDECNEANDNLRKFKEDIKEASEFIKTVENDIKDGKEELWPLDKIKEHLKNLNHYILLNYAGGKFRLNPNSILDIRTFSPKDSTESTEETDNTAQDTKESPFRLLKSCNIMQALVAEFDCNELLLVANGNSPEVSTQEHIVWLRDNIKGDNVKTTSGGKRFACMSADSRAYRAGLYKKPDDIDKEPSVSLIYNIDTYTDKSEIRELQSNILLKDEPGMNESAQEPQPEPEPTSQEPQPEPESEPQPEQEPQPEPEQTPQPEPEPQQASTEKHQSMSKQKKTDIALTKRKSVKSPKGSVYDEVAFSILLSQTFSRTNTKTKTTAKKKKKKQESQNNTKKENILLPILPSDYVDLIMYDYSEVEVPEGLVSYDPAYDVMSYMGW